MGLSDWLRAAKTQTNAAANIHAAGLEGMPDIVGLQVTAMNAKSKERQTAIAAEAKVRQAGMRALGNVKETRIGVDAKEEINDMKVDNFRKAGIIGALGTVAAGGVSAMQNNQADKRAAERAAREDALEDKRTSILNSYRNSGGNSFDEWLKNNPQPGADKPSTSSSPSTTSTTSSTSSTSSTPSTSSTSKNPWKALSTVIRTVEGTLGDKGYTTRFGGSQFSDLSQHPNIAAPTPWGTKSEAAGAYQFMKPTWDEAKAALGLKDFSRESQEAAGKFLTQRRGVSTDTAFTTFEEFTEAISKLSPEWAGLPNSSNGRKGYHGQANADMNELWQIYQQNL